MFASQTDTPAEKWFGPRMFVPWNCLKKSGIVFIVVQALHLTFCSVSLTDKMVNLNWSDSCSDGPINSHIYKSFEIYALTIKISMTEYHHWARGGGGALTSQLGRGGAAGGSKPDPVTNRSAHKKYTLSQYTLLKTFICIPCWNIAHLG